VRRSLTVTLTGEALLASMMMCTSACATRASVVAASTYGGASVYRSATAHVELPPDRAFNPAAKMLLERGDIEITDLKEAENRCRAVSGAHTITLRVIESSGGRSRISILVGGGDDSDASQVLADDLISRICARLGTTCVFGTGES
jgi:hypothetical protein